MVRLDKPVGVKRNEVGWGSDIAAEMLRRTGFKYISLNPGASYRGFHDSIVNYLGNEQPSIILCQHEDHAVAIAHGYAKASGEPMACALHSNVGLMHGSMALYNAWCDRAPIMVIGATGPLNSAARRPWIDWIHSSVDQASIIRDYIKFDEQPSSVGGLIEAILRANILLRAHPSAPVYICLDAGLQETKIGPGVEFPDMARYAPPATPRPSREAIERAIDLLTHAKRPLVLAGRGGRSQSAWNDRIALVERLGACVLTDMKGRAAFPTDHPAHVIAPLSGIGGRAAQQAFHEADVVLSLDWIDLEGTLGPLGATTKVIHVSLDYTLHNGSHANYLGLPAVDVMVASTSDEMVTDLLTALGQGTTKTAWREPDAVPAVTATSNMTVPQIARHLRDAFDDPDKVSFCRVSRGWPTRWWPFRHPLSYFGADGGAGIGSGPGIAVGIALAIHQLGRYPVAVLGDGDFLMGASAIWTAARHKIPLLVIVNNNRSYYNDELHQQDVANSRERPTENSWIGQRLSDPDVDIAKLSESYGAIGIGPITHIDALAEAMRRGAEVVRQGGVCVVDVHTDSTQDSGATGERKHA